LKEKLFYFIGEVVFFAELFISISFIALPRWFNSFLIESIE